ncbi:DUF1801 domain-containing protein [Hydrogenophaga laconesensis]|uniref:YdhG-like domain-containing protein n=1 Tax=Hydrogenophaga laconesensis TaxID=1805971 RepID=A0ABU1VCB9_9BURK|nr:DUF1801 domain-containing protein [Hydrogenophaga laconesensis]MDR7094970.1 hypothetical protein [Hydrogenophaga laconesensis]
MKNLVTSTTPDDHLAALQGWQQQAVAALHSAVLHAAPALTAVIKWGHLVYLSNGPVLLIRAEASRVLFGFWRGQRLRAIEPRLKPGGQFEMATMPLTLETSLDRDTVVRLVREAVGLNAALGDPTKPAR